MPAQEGTTAELPVALRFPTRVDAFVARRADPASRDVMRMVGSPYPSALLDAAAVVLFSVGRVRVPRRCEGSTRSSCIPRSGKRRRSGAVRVGAAPPPSRSCIRATLSPRRADTLQQTGSCTQNGRQDRPNEGWWFQDDGARRRTLGAAALRGTSRGHQSPEERSRRPRRGAPRTSSPCPQRPPTRRSCRLPRCSHEGRG